MMENAITYENLIEKIKTDLIRRYSLSANKLTEEQLAEAIRQALACGDFERHLEFGGSKQSVVYLPYREMERLKSRVAELEAWLDKTVI